MPSVPAHDHLAAIAKRRRSTTCWSVALITCLVAWFGYWSLGFILLPLIIAGICYLCVKRSYGLAAAVLIINPFVLTIVLAANNYMSGQPRLTGAGLPGTSSWNLNPDLRIERRSGGCIITPGRDAHITLHNFTTRLLVNRFGPPEDAYLGPYPTQEELVAALNANGELPGSVEITPADLAADTLTLPDRTQTLWSKEGRGMLDCYWPEYSYWESWPTNLPPERWPAIRAVEWDEPAQAPSGTLVLIDGDTGKAFACYEYGNQSYGGPPWFFYERDPQTH